MSTESKGETMFEPFIFINTYRVKDGKLEAFRKKFQETVEAAQANEPRLLHFATYFSEDGTEATTVQVHPNAEHMGFHMQVVASHIEEAHEYLDFTKMGIQIYGMPNDAILEQMRQIAGSGVPISIKSQSIGFNRLPEL
jgi:quinol monooxygenase YgiN